MPKTTTAAKLSLVVCFLCLTFASARTSIGMTSTAAPRASGSLHDFWIACEERKHAIKEWEAGQMRKLEDEWMDSDLGLLKLGAKAERVKEEADDREDELMENCKAKARSKFDWEGN